MPADEPPPVEPPPVVRLPRVLDVALAGPGTWDVSVHGDFDLHQTRRFGFGQRDEVAGDTLRMAFCVDDDGHRQAAVAVTAPAPGVLRVAVQGAADPQRVLAQTARVLSVDVDATGYDALAARDPLVARLQAARPGLRPPLFHSAYEALCWAVLSARRPARQMAQVRDALSRSSGRIFTDGGVQLAAFPTPDQLLASTEVPGLPDVKLQRLHVVAEQAREGRLGTDALRELDPAVAGVRLRELPGIGPFYSELVTVRTLGHTDLLPSVETGAAEIAGSLVGRHTDVPGLATLSAGWSPWRTWLCVALRAAGPVALGEQPVSSGRPRRR